jgi:protein-disulfide isomerase
MRKCVIAGDGLEMLKKDVAIGEALGIHASPTYLINNKHIEKTKPTAIHASPTYLINNKHIEKTKPTAEHIVEAFCEHNQALDRCSGL